MRDRSFPMHSFNMDHKLALFSCCLGLGSRSLLEGGGCISLQRGTDTLVAATSLGIYNTGIVVAIQILPLFCGCVEDHMRVEVQDQGNSMLALTHSLPDHQ